MKRIIIRKDLLSKSNYAKQFNISRPTLDIKIKQGLIPIERIDGVDYIRIVE